MTDDTDLLIEDTRELLHVAAPTTLAGATSDALRALTTTRKFPPSPSGGLLDTSPPLSHAWWDASRWPTTSHHAEPFGA